MIATIMLIGLYILFGLVLYLTRKKSDTHQVHDIIVEELKGDVKNHKEQYKD